MYGAYITDVQQQVDAVMTLFVMEKELRVIKNREHFPVPKITPQATRIEDPYQLRKTLEAVDEEAVQMINATRDSERNYEKERKQKPEIGNN